jgi:hypothetical protein
LSYENFPIFMPLNPIFLANTAKNNREIEVISDYLYRRVGTLLPFYRGGVKNECRSI